MNFCLLSSTDFTRCVIDITGLNGELTIAAYLAGMVIKLIGYGKLLGVDAANSPQLIIYAIRFQLQTVTIDGATIVI